MRRFAVILLFAAFVLPIVVPLLALGQDPEAGLPMCCRRNGKHHCMMTMAERAAVASKDSGSYRWTGPVERCPYCPASVASSHWGGFAAVSTTSATAFLFSQPLGIVQTNSRRRISRDRSRQKRGPPAMSLV